MKVRVGEEEEEEKRKRKKMKDVGRYKGRENPSPLPSSHAPYKIDGR